MNTSEPPRLRTIDPAEIKIGMRVRADWVLRDNTYECAIEGHVMDVGSEAVQLKGIGRWNLRLYGRTWSLLEPAQDPGTLRSLQ